MSANRRSICEGAKASGAQEQKTRCVLKEAPKRRREKIKKKLKKPKKNKEQKKAEFEAEERTKKNTRREEEACTKSKRGSGLAHLEQMLGRKLLDRERAEVEETNAALERAGWEWHVTDIYKNIKDEASPPIGYKINARQDARVQGIRCSHDNGGVSSSGCTAW